MHLSVANRARTTVLNFSSAEDLHQRGSDVYGRFVESAQAEPWEQQQNEGIYSQKCNLPPRSRDADLPALPVHNVERRNIT